MRKIILLFLISLLNISIAQTTITIGTQVVQSGTTDISPYNYYWESRRVQFVYTASEIIAAGGFAGTISAIAFDVSQVNGGNLLNYTVRMAHTTATDASSHNNATLTVVKNPHTLIPGSTGWRTITFDNNFEWNGTDNILVDICWGVNTGYAANGQVWLYNNVANQMRGVYSGTTSQCGNTTTTTRSGKPRVQFTITPAANMTYESSTTEQASTSIVSVGSTNQPVIRLKVVTSGSQNPFNVTSITFTTNGTTNTSDLTAAKVYYTTSPTFSTANQFGSTINNPNGTLTFTGSQQLASGNNYFWLAYDISSSATVNNVIDGTCTQFVTSEGGGTTRTPDVTDPTGSRTIKGPLSGNVNVGTGQEYTNLTSSGGLFEAINLLGLSGNLNVFITSDLSEDGTNALNQWTEYGGSGYYLIIQPSAATVRTISGSYNGGLIRLNGADRVTIDGRYSGGGNYLTFSNTSTNTDHMVIQLISLGTGQGCENVTIRNTTIQTGSSSVNSIGIHAGGSTFATNGADHDNLSIIDNVINVASYGILVFGNASTSSGGADNLTITGNVITCNTSVQSIGIRVRNALNSTISGNELDIRQSSSNAPVGISLETGVNNTTVSRNLVKRVAYTGTSGYGGRGIVIGTGLTSSNITVVNNVIYGVTGDNYSGFGNSSSMGIAIGVDGSTSTLTTTTGGVNLYYNSVNMYGTYNSSTACITTALYVGSGASNLNIRNNVFVNTMDNLGTTSKSYAIYSAAGASAFSQIDYNDYYAPAPEGVLGFLTSDRTSLSAWQTATGQDANSLASDPLFNSNTNLVPQPGSPLQAAGTPISGITTDYLGNTRNASTPTIGAYENTGDAAPPTITYTALSNTASTSNRVLTNFATITDPSGVNTTTYKPRLYFKKSTDNNTYVGNTASDNGWKYVEASNASSPFSFTIDYSIIYGGSVSTGDVIQYFVVAQDEAPTPNVGINSGTFASTPSSVDLTAAAFPIGGTINSYTIMQSISGNVTVGSGGTYSTLTGPSGLFADINSKMVTGNITATIISDLSEPGTNALNQMATEGGDWTLTIVPDETTVRTISGDVSGGLIRLNGADRVTIDGRYSGSGKYLRFRNTNTSGPTFTFINDASDNTIRDCYIEGATNSTSNGVVFFSTGATTGNDNNMIRDCVIRDRSDAAGVPANLIFSQGSSSTVRNSNNTILNCQLFNFTADGISLSSVNGANESWTITGNDISQNATATSTITGIRLNSYGNNLVSQNLIHDLNTSGSVRGIFVDDITNVTIERNRIYNIPSTSGSTGTLYGIYVFGFSGNCRARIYNNQISIVPSHSNAQTVYGIREWADTGDSTYLFYNSVFVGGTGSGTSKSYAYDDNSGTTHNVVYNNAFVNVRTGGTGGHFAARHGSTGSITSTLTDNNFYVGNGPTAGNNFELSSTASSFTSWKAAYTGAKKDNYSYSINSADLTVSNLFTNAPSGDLSVINTNQECWLLNGKGQPIETVNNDYAGNSRSTSVANGPTDIGAYEFTPTVNPPAATPSAPPAPNTTTNYSVAGNPIVSIAWGGSGTVPTSVDVQYYSGTPAPSSVNKPRINAYWNITQTGGSGFTYDITLTYDEAQLGSINENNLIPAKSDDGGTTWTPYTVEGTGAGEFQRNTTANTITIYGLSSFSLFTLGDNNDPLPVQLSSFTASTKGRDVILNWTTATEVNTAGFEIERKLVSQEKAQSKWENVGFVRGNGNSNRPIEYTFTDMKLNTGKYAYRLKMIDNDGSYEYSDEVQVEIGKPDVTKIEQNYPNAFNPATKIEYQLANPSKVVIEVYNITGQKITELVNDEQVEGYYSLVFDASKYGLASGIYFYRMIAMDRVTGKNVVMTKKMLYLK